MADGTLKVGQITTSSGSGTITLGQSGETVTIPTGATITNSGTANGFGGANTPMFQAVMSGNQSLSQGSTTKIAFNTETFDTASAYDTSAYRFTPQVAGKYQFDVSLQFNVGGSSLAYCYTYIYKNGSANKISLNDFQNNSANTHNGTASHIIDMNGSSDYVEAYGHVFAAGTIGAVSGTAKASVFKGYKIIE